MIMLNKDLLFHCHCHYFPLSGLFFQMFILHLITVVKITIGSTKIFRHVFASKEKKCCTARLSFRIIHLTVSSIHPAVLCNLYKYGSTELFEFHVSKDRI